LQGGTLEGEATFSGQLEIVRMNRRPTLMGGCCTQCMLYSVDAVPGVCCTQCMPESQCMQHLVLAHNHGMERQSDDFTLCSAMMVELRTRKRDRG